MAGELPCHQELPHLTTVVSAEASLNCFAMCYELPIPWNDILTHHEKLFLNDHCCLGGLELIVGRHCCLAEKQNWQLHCHCSDFRSLQCFSAKNVIFQFVNKFLQGGSFNRSQLWYREFVNHNLPDDVLYVGSMMWGNTHFIYLKLSCSKQIESRFMEVVRESINSDMASVIRGRWNWWLVLKCHTCPVSENIISYRSCSVRTRKIIQRILRTLRLAPNIPHLRYTASHWEEKRQRHLRRAMMYGCCCHIPSIVHVDLNNYLRF